MISLGEEADALARGTSTPPSALVLRKVSSREMLSSAIVVFSVSSVG
ncbi:MAG: hypothetical protein R3C32_12050 [Chloroflexota bacterium]